MVLDGSDTTLIRADTAKALHNESSLPSKKVRFHLSCSQQRTHKLIDNAWVIDQLDVPKNKY